MGGVSRRTANAAAQAGTALPYYSRLQKAVYLFLELVRAVYTALVPPAVRRRTFGCGCGRAWRCCAKDRQSPCPPGQSAALGAFGRALGMALLRCFMIAFMEVASF